MTQRVNMRVFYFLLTFFAISNCFYTQVILNAYAKVTGVSNSSILAVSNVNIANHTFTVGGTVILMQMQDDVIGSNVGNSSAFGDLSTIANAGIYQLLTINAVSPASGTPTTVTLSSTISAAYNTGSNSSLQLITLRNLGSNFTTSSNITGLAWDGNVGGVIAIEVTNTLTLNHSISANAIGFRGGARSAAAGGGCDPGTYRTNSTLDGFKGEGIFKATNANHSNGRGHILNGGGGGNEHNAGGAGGGNYTAGGAGGPGYGCGTPAGGIGGASLSGQITASRIFMGGGGGGGGQNNGYASDGVSGGGIVLIKANTILTNNTCGSPIGITANGATAVNVGNDGAGGGGAAGTIVLNVNTFSITSTCSLAINANGGGGGSVTDGTQHAGGGGGGQGAVVYSIAQPTTNMQTTTNNGAGGRNSSGGSYAGSGAGSNNSGIIPSAAGPLPIELIEFKAELLSNKVKLSWTTASEKNNDYFTLERSTDGQNFKEIGKLQGAGNSRSKLSYSYDDTSPNYGMNYYRLKQTDFNGVYKYTDLIGLNVDKYVEQIIFPNPVSKNGLLNISIENDNRKQYDLQIYSITGKEIYSGLVTKDQDQSYTLNLLPLDLQPGIYLIRLSGLYSNSLSKLVVQ